MSFVPTRNLSRLSSDTVRDWQHAARLFTDGQFALAPKFKFTYHVVFGLNRAALRDISLHHVHKDEINMLVKSADLPNFNVKVESLNQYNRRKNIQYRHEYKPLTVVFHDDNLGVINNLWNNYYSYYYADPSSSTVPGAYNRNATKNYNYNPTSYGLDNGSTSPFFTYIKMYQMARHEYVCYTLHNPLITAWNHNKVAYDQNTIHDNTMTLDYEAVSYSYGNVDPEIAQIPEGFAKSHYDTVPSPLSGSKIEGQASSSFIESSILKNSAASNLGNILETINSYQNTTNITQPSVNNIVFPQSATNNNTVVANQKTF